MDIQTASAVVAASPEAESLMTNQYVQYLLAASPQAIIIIALLLVIYRAHKNITSPFNVFDYFIDGTTGKASITRSLQMLAGLTATWIVVKMATLGTLTVEMFAVYLAALGISEGWSKFVGAKYGAQSSTSVTPINEESK